MDLRNTGLRIALAIGPVLLALLITALLILAVGSDPVAVLEKTWQGAFRNSESFASVVNFWIPLTLVSVGLVVTFRAGLWNIGIEGQMMFGAVFASWAAQFLPLGEGLSFLLIVIELLLAFIGGLLWGLVVGVLKVKLGVHEIFGGVALNALANVWSIYLIAGPWQPPEGGSAQATPPFPEPSLLPEMSNKFPVSLLALVIVILAAGGVAMALRGTRWGLNLKATGKNARSALLLGVPTDRTALSAFAVCGGLAGLAGSYRVLLTYDSLRPLVSGGIGFLGLLVVLIAGTSGAYLTQSPFGGRIKIPVLGKLLENIGALWVPLIAFFFAAIFTGSTRLKIALGLDASLAGVLQGILVLVVLLFNGVRQNIEERRHPAERVDSGFDPVTTPTEGAD